MGTDPSSHEEQVNPILCDLRRNQLEMCNYNNQIIVENILNKKDCNQFLKFNNKIKIWDMRKHFLQAWSGEPQLQQDIKTTVVSKEIKCQMIYFLTIMVNTSIDRVEKV